MILITEYNSYTLNKNLESNIFDYIFIKTDEKINIIDNKIKIFESKLSEFEIINKYVDEIFVIANYNIEFNKLEDNIIIDYINKFGNNIIFNIKLQDNISYYLIKSPIINQKIINFKNCFNYNIYEDIEYYIYINGFWNGFIEKTDANHIDFFENIFKKTKLYKYKITNDLEKANVLFESVFSNSLINYKIWKYRIHYSGEVKVNDYKNYDIVLFSDKTVNNVVDCPLFVYYIYTNNFLDRIINKRKIEKVPEKFCCFIVSNGNCIIRNKMFDILNLYKKIDSYGNYNNNMDMNLKFNYWSEEYINFLSTYKFIICFENSKFETYITEKIINPYLAGIIPIYWGTHHSKKVFNEDSFLLLEDESDLSFQKLLKKIIELDNNNDKYLEYVNNKILNLNYFLDNYTIDKISNNIDKIL